MVRFSYKSFVVWVGYREVLVTNLERGETVEEVREEIMQERSKCE